MAEICRDPEVAKTMFDILETQRIAESDCHLTLVRTSANGLLADLLERGAGRSSKSMMHLFLIAVAVALAQSESTKPKLETVADKAQFERWQEVMDMHCNRRLAGCRSGGFHAQCHREQRRQTAPMKSAGEHRLPARPAFVVLCGYGKCVALAEINHPPR